MMMESQASIKLFGQVIFIDGEDHGDHEELVLSNYEMDNSPAVKDRNQNEAETEKFAEPEDDQKKGDGTSNCKPPKKPDKILPCPRCNSMDTKFCYFNNYNINQPRYFCRNCQRYWTAGGTMRNVPVGAGRRKSKSCSNSKHITISEATLRAVELACQEPTHRSLAFLNNGLVTGDGAKLNPVKEFQVPDTDIHPRKSAQDCSEEKCKEAHHGSVNNICQVHTLQVPYFNGSSWLYQWNPAAPLPNSGYPVGFHLVSPYWGAAVSPPPSVGSSVAAPPSPLGKHIRGGDISKQSDNSDTLADGDKRGPASVPKMMRIDNPDEVAKSSIWTTVGIKRDKAGGITKGGLYSAFHPKEHKKESTNAELAAILSANPAALARSLNYRESA